MIKDIETTEHYWDCECVGSPSEYIHPKSQTVCIECGQHQDDMPDSRIDEVELAFSNPDWIVNSYDLQHGDI